MRKPGQWLGLVGSFILASAVPAGAGWASSHREAPLIAQDPEADSTDVYFFRSPIEDQNGAGTVTILTDYIPFEEPGGGPNFYMPADSVLYEIKIDNTGDAREDITYQFRFTTKYLAPTTSFLYNKGPITSPTDPNLLVQQTYTVTRIDKNGKTTTANIPIAPWYVGSRSYPAQNGLTSDQVYENVAEKAITELTTAGGGKVFVGPRDDPFYVDLGATFDLLGIRPGPPGGTGNNGGIDFLGGYNINTFALQLPLTAISSDGSDCAQMTHGKQSVVGVWTTASRQKVTVLRADKGQPTYSGQFIQVSRLAIPLVNEVLIPIGVKDFYNHTQPRDDAKNAAGFLKDPELARLFHSLYGVTVPAPGRTDLINLISFNVGVAPLDVPGLQPADILRLDVSVPASTINPASRLGLLAGDPAGFPNGRRLADDAVDIDERAVAGVLCSTKNLSCDIDANPIQLGDGVDQNDRPFLTHFPYAGIPWSGSAGSPIHTKPPAHM